MWRGSRSPCVLTDVDKPHDTRPVPRHASPRLARRLYGHPLVFRAALFVPAGYTPARAWPVIFAFDPGGRGRTPVERYQAAAERYGFIVVGSNNSRNGSTEIPKILAAMTADVAERLAVDPKRVYLAGMSGSIVR